MKGIVLLHTTCSPKNASSKILQMIFNKISKERFRDTLNVDKHMIACHNPDNIRRLITRSSLKECEVKENSANYHADQDGTNPIDNETNIASRTKETLVKEKITTMRIEITNSKLQNSGIMMHHNA